MANGKRIALFLDGTWNTVNDNTNVFRMKSLCLAGEDQVCYYSAGVGTQYGERVIGGMFGYGLDAEVIQAYEWLAEHYAPADRVFIFGFSRGAFTARSLAGFISKCGLLKAGAPLSLKQLYDRYKRGSVPFSILHLQKEPDTNLQPEDRWLKKYSLPIPIWFQGVWDTVGALGVPFGNIPIISRSNYGWLETDLRINDTRAFHALAIDEHREAFAPTLWKKTVVEDAAAFPPRPVADVEQRWFVGAHADVGGGYPNGLLAQIPLLWLMQKAQAHGLVFKELISIAGIVPPAIEHTGVNSLVDDGRRRLAAQYRRCPDIAIVWPKQFADTVSAARHLLERIVDGRCIFISPRFDAAQQGKLESLAVPGIQCLWRQLCNISRSLPGSSVWASSFLVASLAAASPQPPPGPSDAQCWPHTFPERLPTATLR